ncbi:MAG: hypothetical protein INR63_29285 [Actinomycetospora chiangmaiensis]|nr:hypothetical protein [Actinomycetospora chiangmaiensis]
MLEAGAPVPLGLGDLGVVLCPRRCVPLGFFRPAGVAGPDAVTALLSLVDGHLGPLACACARAALLSERLLRENAAWPLVFALGRALREAPGCRPAVEAFLDRLAGAQAPIAIPSEAVLEGAPFRRRLCCLRDRVPGCARCPGLCPRDALPSAR